MSAPVLGPHTADELLARLRSRLPAYVPGWAPAEGGPGDAILRIYARYLAALAERIERTPDKNELAFLDLLGLELLAAQAARAPVVLATAPKLGDGRAPAGTRLAAPAADGADPIVFETETAIELAAARIAEVVSLWPGRDAYADHSADAVGGRPFTPWSGLRPIRHELYLAHDLHLALAGAARVELDVSLAPGGSTHLPIVWQAWDGDLWRDLAPPAPGDDGTVGLTRNGTITLRSECARTRPTAVGGFTSHWLRGRLDAPLPPDGRVLPGIDRIRLRTVLERSVGDSGAAGLLPDAAFAGGSRLDPTKPFQPFGPAPAPDTSFYVACEEAFSRPGATITIGVGRPYTAQERHDIELARYEVGVNEAKARLDQLKQVAASLDAALRALIDPTTGELRADTTPLFDGTTLEDWYADVRKHAQDALDAVRSMAGPAQATRDQVAGTAAALLVWDALPPEPVSKGVAAVVAMLALRIPLAVVAVSDAMIVTGLARAAAALSTGSTTLQSHLASLEGSLTAINADIAQLGNGDVGAAIRILGATPTLLANWLTVASDLDDWPRDIFLGPALPQIFVTARARYAEMRARIDQANAKIRAALGTGATLEDLLDQLAPEVAAAAAKVVKPKLPQPTLRWEYWNGVAWARLRVRAVDATGAESQAPRNLWHGRGRVRFTAPADWEPTTVNGAEGRFLRIRVGKGAFAIVKLVSWFDDRSQSINYLPVGEPRPPLLDVFSIGYEWRSPAAPPERCLTLNDFRWDDRTEQAARNGAPFPPFSPTADTVPALYVGFDRPLPTGRTGLFLDAEEETDAVPAPGLEWEHWDGSTWARLAVDDETENLRVAGALGVLWPGTDEPAPVPLRGARGSEARVADARSAAGFAAGDVVWLSEGERGELAKVEAVAGDAITLRAPLTGAYPRGEVRRAGLPRFGTPRTWLRARLRTDGEPHRPRVNGLHLNATWAAQVQTIRDELIGSSDGRPRQTFSLARSPVLAGEMIEVRELEGARAGVELPLLLEELTRAGIGEDEVRTVTSPRTGAVTEVWVPWRRRPSLLFSGPADRHYVIERSHGRVLFGDGVAGRIPPAGANTIRARRYRSGGGAAGNVATGAIDRVLSGVIVEGVANPRPGEGGAAGEIETAVLSRGPATLRNRRQALSADDYAALAREASPGVALARTLPATRPDGRPAPGWVTVIVVPQSDEPEPSPSLELRRIVRSFLIARTPATLASRLAVVGPTYHRVGVEAIVAPVTPELAGPVAAATRDALTAFLHPLTGGPAGSGWGERRDVYLSDLAAVVERVDGVDHASSLLLVDGGTPAGDALTVPTGRLVSAGLVEVRLAGREG